MLSECILIEEMHWYSNIYTVCFNYKNLVQLKVCSVEGVVHYSNIKIKI